MNKNNKEDEKLHKILSNFVIAKKNIGNRFDYSGIGFTVIISHILLAWGFIYNCYFNLISFNFSNYILSFFIKSVTDDNEDTSNTSLSQFFNVKIFFIILCYQILVGIPTILLLVRKGTKRTNILDCFSTLLIFITLFVLMIALLNYTHFVKTTYPEFYSHKDILIPLVLSLLVGILLAYVLNKSITLEYAAIIDIIVSSAVFIGTGDNLITSLGLIGIKIVFTGIFYSTFICSLDSVVIGAICNCIFIFSLYYLKNCQSIVHHLEKRSILSPDYNNVLNKLKNFL